jgi:hypothetical protein
MGTTDSKPVYIKPGDIKAQAVFMDGQPPDEIQSDSIPLTKIPVRSDSESLSDTQSGTVSDTQSGGEVSPSPSESGGSAPTPYPTKPATGILASELTSALNIGMSTQYGTNAGSIQRKLGKTPGSMYGGSKVPIPVPNITTNMEGVSYFPAAYNTRFNSGIQPFEYK